MSAKDYFTFDGKTYKVVDSQLFEVHPGQCLIAEHDPNPLLELEAHCHGYKRAGIIDPQGYGNQNGKRSSTNASIQDANGKYGPLEEGWKKGEVNDYDLLEATDGFIAPNYHAFRIRYVAWTATQGARVSIKSLRHDVRVIIPLTGESAVEDAILYLLLKGYSIRGQAEEQGKGMILFSDNFSPDFK